MTPLQLGEVRVVPFTMPPAERLALLVDAAVREQGTHAVQLLAVEAQKSARPVASALQLVQLMPRLPDPPDGDRLSGPTATAVHGGDCASLSALLLSVLVAMGDDARLVLLPWACDPQDHVAVIVRVDGHWTWADPASLLPLGRVTSGAPCPLPSSDGPG